MKTYFNLQVGLCQIQQERWAEHWMVADFSVDSVTSKNCDYRESTKRAHRKKKNTTKQIEPDSSKVFYFSSVLLPQFCTDR